MLNKVQKNSFIKILILITAICLLGGCGKVKDKTFVKDDMSIVLTDKFREDELAGQTAYYLSAKSIVVILKEDFSSLSGYNTDDMDVMKYAELVVDSNSFDTEIVVIEGIPTWEYQKTIAGNDFGYFAATYKGDRAFYLVQFACELDEFTEFKADFIKWAKSFKHS